MQQFTSERHPYFSRFPPVGDRLFRSPNSTTISQVMLSIGVESMTLITSLPICTRGECVENCDVL